MSNQPKPASTWPVKVRSRMKAEVGKAAKAYIDFIEGRGDFYPIGFIEDRKGEVHYYNISEIDEDSFDTLKMLASDHDGVFVACIGTGTLIQETEDDHIELTGVIMMLEYHGVIYSMFQEIKVDRTIGKLIEFEAKVVHGHEDFSE